MARVKVLALLTRERIGEGKLGTKRHTRSIVYATSREQHERPTPLGIMSELGRMGRSAQVPFLLAERAV